MKYMLIMLTLFSFQQGRNYLVQEVSCKENEIRIRYEGEWYEIQLFNIVLKEKVDVCPYLNGKISIEIDPYVKVENPLNVYLFNDGHLIQQQLINDDKAEIKITHPKYKYKLHQQSDPVMKKMETKKQIRSSQTRKRAGILMRVWGILVFLLGYHYVKVRH